MKTFGYLAALAAASMIAGPVAAAPNPAASLSVAKSVRTGSASAKKSDAVGSTGTIGLIVAALIVAAGVVILVDSGSPDIADSN